MDTDNMTLLPGHVDEATAYVVDDYPYGFNARTQIRYWIESVKNKGDRFVSQTLNPKTNRWNKPKKSTYAPVKAMVLNEDGHVKTVGLGLWHTNEDAEAFIEFVGKDNLNEVQRLSLAKVIGLNNVMDKVTFSIHEGPTTPEHDAEQDEIKRTINRAVAVASAQAHQAL